MRQSLVTSALCLTLVQTVVDARAHNKFAQLKIRNGQPVVEAAEQGALLGWAQSLKRRILHPNTILHRDTCYEDAYYNFMQDLPEGEQFCQYFLNSPNETVTVDYTPTR